MKNKQNNIWKNLIVGFLVFCVFGYLGFGSLVMYVQKTNIDANAKYVTQRLTQLQLNLEATSTVYTNAFGDKNSKTNYINDLVEESHRIKSYEELNILITNVMVLKKDVTFSNSANRHQQKVLNYILYVTNKLNTGVIEFDEKVNFYNGASKMFPGVKNFFPINIDYLEL
ncbi:MAG: hypothetical protein KAH01_04430 [Caldisericia bacterium]|nr:hypothetical protein [Caldisericia bacterium]